MARWRSVVGLPEVLFDNIGRPLRSLLVVQTRECVQVTSSGSRDGCGYGGRLGGPLEDPTARLCRVPGRSLAGGRARGSRSLSGVHSRVLEDSDPKVATATGFHFWHQRSKSLEHKVLVCRV